MKMRFGEKSITETKYEILLKSFTYITTTKLQVEIKINKIKIEMYDQIQNWYWIIMAIQVFGCILR